MDTLERVKVIINKIKALQKEGRTLREISQITYKMRMDGEDMIYFGWGTSSANAYLVPRPIATQKEYKQFFEEVAPGAVSLPRYSLYVYESYIDFHEKFYKDKKLTKVEI